MGYSPWSLTESDMTEATEHAKGIISICLKRGSTYLSVQIVMFFLKQKEVFSSGHLAVIVHVFLD